MRVFIAWTFTPLLVLIVLAVVLVPVSASLFNIPKIDMDKFSLGDGARDRSGTTTTTDKSIAPFSDLFTTPFASSTFSGISLPSGWSGMFRSPITTQQSYTRTYTTPEGPKTQAMYRSYDGTTGAR
jgi:hypothetical protein